MTAQQLYDLARQTIHPIPLKGEASAGQIACALETQTGRTFTGICIDMPCSLGFCAEQAAMAEMLKAGETKVSKIIAVYQDGSILAPCGRCREFLSQLDDANQDTIVILPDFQETTLKKLLPHPWDEEK